MAPKNVIVTPTARCTRSSANCTTLSPCTDVAAPSRFPYSNLPFKVVDSNGSLLTRDSFVSACVAALSTPPSDTAISKRKRKAGSGAEPSVAPVLVISGKKKHVLAAPAAAAAPTASGKRSRPLR